MNADPHAKQKELTMNESWAMNGWQRICRKVEVQMPDVAGLSRGCSVAIHPPEQPDGILVFWSDEKGCHSLSVRTDRFGLMGKVRAFVYRQRGLA